MKKSCFLAGLLVLALSGFAQKKKLPKPVTSAPAPVTISMSADRWTAEPDMVQFLTYKSVSAMKVLPKGKAILNNLVFANGTIEFDVDPEDPRFVGIYFRRQNDEDAEYFYLRMGRAGNLVAMDAVQYAPFIKGVNLWDLLPAYQGPASFRRGEWNHIKLVVSGQQMRAYVNDMNRPALDIPQVGGNASEGGLAFDGAAVIANLVVKPGEVGDVPPGAGLDPARHDSRYIRRWTVTEPILLPKGREPTNDDFPKAEATWQPVDAERIGLVNLTRLFGKSPTRRMVWMKAKLRSTTDQQRRVALGFSDEVWVFINGRMVYADKNLYNQPIMKEPEGRCSPENGSFTVPLKAGENELLIGLANDFFGWGLIAQFDTMEGIHVD